MGAVITLLAIVVVTVALVVLLAGLVVPRRRKERQERQERARQEYGSEFERTVRERGSERRAEQELGKRREKVERDIRPLPDESRRRYEEEWDRVEHAFVEDPVASLDAADRVVTEILVERNLPADSRQAASKGVGVMYPDVVENFREAQRTQAEATRSPSDADPEKMRRAIQEYRSVYEHLMRG